MMKMLFGAALAITVLAELAFFGLARAANPVCTLYQTSGCNVCNSTGTAWANDDSRCASGQVCQNMVCVAAASQIKSSFDSVNCTTLQGWICDPNSPGSQFGVEFYMDDTTTNGYLGYAVAASTRNDIANLCGGSAAHGFSFMVPANTTNSSRTIYDGNTHTIHAIGKRNAGDWYILAGSPKITNCASSACQDECSPSGVRICSGSGYATCGNYDSDSCLEWSPVVNCDSGSTCQNGLCSIIKKADMAACVSASECQSNICLEGYCGLKPNGMVCINNNTCASGSCVNNVCVTCVPKNCVALGGYTCGSWDNGCNATIGCGVCQSNQVCSNGFCVSNCATHNSKKCDGGDLYWYNSCSVKEDLAQDCGANLATSVYRCTGNVAEQETLSKDCVNGACTQSENWAAVQDCAKVSKVCKNGVCVTSDTVPPVISKLSPSGTLYSANAVLSLTTNETAECRYSLYNKTFDAMTAQFGSSNKLYHSASIALSNLGNYVYYVRCRDIAGNANPAAVKISFRYASANVVTAPAAQETAKNNQPPVISETPLSEKAGTSTVAITAVQAPGPVISNPSPSGVIYQKTVSLGIITDKPAECRYAADDRDFDSMDGQFFVADGQQQATVNLNEYGSYNYYVRCKDVSGNKDIVSQVISFEYQNLDPPPGENVTPPPAAALDCAKYTTAAADSVCDKFVDCVCDPDCPVAPDPGADPDCAKAAAGSQGKVGTSFPVFAVVSFILIAVAIVVVSIIIRKRKGDDGEEAEES